jgi:hypothetical protein
VVVAVEVRVPAIVLEVRGDLVPLGLDVWVFDAAADLVNDADAVVVLDCPAVLVTVGETEDVLELVVVDVDVLVRSGVLDCWPVEVGVFDTNELLVRAGDAEGDFEELDVLVDVIVLVVVLVLVVERLTKAVGITLRVRVVVLVDVFDKVLVAVDTTTSPTSTLPDARVVSSVDQLRVWGLEAMEPIAVSNKSQRMPIYI